MQSISGWIHRPYLKTFTWGPANSLDSLTTIGSMLRPYFMASVCTFVRKKKKTMQVGMSNFIYLNCGEWYEDMIDHRSYVHNCLSCVYNCDDQSYLHIILRNLNIWNFIYSLISYIHLQSETFYGYITNSQIGQFSYGLIAQLLLEHCTGIAEVMGSNPAQVWIFLRLKFHNRLSCVLN